MSSTLATKRLRKTCESFVVLHPVTRPAGVRNSTLKVVPRARADIDLVAASRQCAAWRAMESAREDSLFKDVFAPFLVDDACNTSTNELEDATRHVLSTRYIDETVLRGTALHHDTRGDYNQVVLVGDCFDTRPFRLPWLAGTVIYLIGPQEVHRAAEGPLKERQARAPRGCLLRRVSADLTAPLDTFSVELPRLGFRGDRPSVWALQGLDALGLGKQQLQDLFVEITTCAGFASIVTGALPPLTRKDAENLLAESGLLGSVSSTRDVGGEYGRWQDEWGVPVSQPQHWLFTSQHQRTSALEVDVYDSHVAAAEEADEDFMGNFS